MEATDTPTTEAPPAKKRSTRNLILRGISAFAILGVVYACLRWDVVNGSGWAWAVLTAIISLPCLHEFYRLAEAVGVQPFGRLAYAMGPAWLLASECDLSGGWPALAGFQISHLVMILFAVCVLLLQLTRKTNDNALNNVSMTVFGLVYCCVLPGLTLHLRHLRLGEGGWPMHGVEFAVTCIFVAKVSDVGALLTGSRWGRTKLIPRLSPGKTWEGLLGGFVFSILLLQLMVATAPWMALARLSTGALVFLSLLLAAAGLGGDLIESAFKRNSQRKDAGAGVPGFGGMLDLMDSLMVATPAMYFFLVFFGAQYVEL